MGTLPATEGSSHLRHLLWTTHTQMSRWEEGLCTGQLILLEPEAKNRSNILQGPMCVFIQLKEGSAHFLHTSSPQSPADAWIPKGRNSKKQIVMWDQSLNDQWNALLTLSLPPTKTGSTVSALNYHCTPSPLLQQGRLLSGEAQKWLNIDTSKEQRPRGKAVLRIEHFFHCWMSFTFYILTTYFSEFFWDF